MRTKIKNTILWSVVIFLVLTSLQFIDSRHVRQANIELEDVMAIHGKDYTASVVELVSKLDQVERCYKLLGGNGPEESFDCIGRLASDARGYGVTLMVATMAEQWMAAYGESGILRNDIQARAIAIGLADIEKHKTVLDAIDRLDMEKDQTFVSRVTGHKTFDGSQYEKRRSEFLAFRQQGR